ncbi:ubiquitin carboxyl-terminal hydrolase 26 [Octodon degus]|uniref:Ubiquitin carboxyl-terminal hydrolase n=1 Tax=Octodon degus TaxID=10160 RepID=A0A6P3FCW2_OCTDE|nr:ubiquitin carboxyl-terminal hydrolase 26 [Octodon degus]
MSGIMVHGFVQMWNKRSGMSNVQEVFLETVEGKKNFKLLMYLKTGKVRTFQLNNNIKNVALTSYGEDLSHIQLTFQNSNFLFIERMASKDAEQLKAFLDRAPQDCPEPHMSPEKGKVVYTSIATQTTETSLPSICNRSDEECSGIDKEIGTFVHQNTPLLSSKSSTLTDKESETQPSKEMQSSDLEVSESEKLPIKKRSIRKKTSANPLKYKSRNWKKPSKTRVSKNSKKVASVAVANSSGGCPRQRTDLQHFSENTVQQLLQALNSGGGPGLKVPHKLKSHTLWQGLPNLGNTCYINAVLQSLCSIPLFVNDVLKQGFPWGRVARDMFCVCVILLLMMKDIFNKQTKELLLVTIRRSSSLVAEMFTVDAQNDAHEFLSFCLEQLENLPKSVLVSKSENKSDKESSSQQAFAGDSAAKRTACAVTSNFECELLHSIFCKICGRVVYKTEPDNYLSLNLPQGKKKSPVSIQSTFDQFLAREALLEYKCEECEQKKAEVMHKFIKIPRILIIHLKRYCFTEFWSLRKDDQKVTVCKYLDLSAHCTEGTKPPVPLSSNAHIRDPELLKVSQNSGLKLLHSLSLVALENSRNTRTRRVESVKQPDSQKSQRSHTERKRVQQQKDVGKACKLDTRESESVCEGEEQLSSSVLNLESVSLPVFPGYRDQLVSKRDTRVTEVPANPKARKSGKISTSEEADFDAASEVTEDFSKDKKTRLKERSQKMAEQSEKYDGVGTHKDAPEQTLSEGLPKPKVRECTVRLTDCTRFSLQEANPGDKDSSDKMESKTQELEEKTDKKNRYTYRLIGIINHIGKNPNSGHYVTDAYDFTKQAWFTYNDLLVSSISESLVQKSRICTGYIFFYMHNEIFEELLLREKTTQSQPEPQPEPEPELESQSKAKAKAKSQSKPQSKSQSCSPKAKKSS